MGKSEVSPCCLLWPSMAWAQSVVRNRFPISVGSRGQDIDHVDKNTCQSTPKMGSWKKNAHNSTSSVWQWRSWCRLGSVSSWMKQATGQDRQTDAWLARQRHSWRNVNIKTANQTSDNVQFNRKWTIKTDSLKWLRVKRIMRPYICIYSCPIEWGVSEPVQKQLVDGNWWCVTHVQGGWRDWSKLQNIVYSSGRYLPL